MKPTKLLVSRSHLAVGLLEEALGPEWMVCAFFHLLTGRRFDLIVVPGVAHNERETAWIEESVRTRLSRDGKLFHI